MHIGLKIFIWGVLGLVVFGALLFGPAGTFDYWQAWVFLAAFVSTTIGPTIYLARNDPAALQRRMRSGPLAEGRTIQKFIVIGAFLGFFAMMVLSACDHRYGWSVRVEAGQILASDGLYKIVRHPMYAGNVVMMTGIPLALGSYWAMFILVPGTLVLVFRILDEEKLLTQELSGYREYRQLVRYRLVPYVW